MQDRLKDTNLDLIGVDLRESPETVKAFVEQRSINYPILLDTDGEVGSQFKVRAIPDVVLIDSKGMIRYDAHTLPDESVLKPFL